MVLNFEKNTLNAKGGEFDGSEVHKVDLRIGNTTLTIRATSTSPKAADISVHRLGENEITIFGKVTKKLRNYEGSTWTDINTKR